MTATPIPRTLTLAQYGEMDVSKLDEMPPGRQAIDTRVIAAERLPEIIDGLARHLAAGKQAYWVCPMVRETEGEDTAAAEARFALLQARFGEDVVLVHGQLRPELKDAAYGGLCQRREEAAGRDDGDRSRRRRAQCDADGDRAGRALRPRPAAPAARAGRARGAAIDLPAAARREPVSKPGASGWR